MKGGFRTMPHCSSLKYIYPKSMLPTYQSSTSPHRPSPTQTHTSIMPSSPHPQQQQQQRNPFPHLANVRKYIRPEIFEYYELRSQGLIRARAYEEWMVEALEDEVFWRRVEGWGVRVGFRGVVWDGGMGGRRKGEGGRGKGEGGVRGAGAEWIVQGWAR